VVLHEDRLVLEHCQHLLTTWLAEIGLTLNVAKSHISHTLDGKQPGVDFLDFHIRQYRVGKHQSDKRPRGRQRLGFKTLTLNLSEFAVGCSWCMCVRVRLNEAPLFSCDWLENGEGFCRKFYLRHFEVSSSSLSHRAS
jgi:hypothetical protein